MRELCRCTTLCCTTLRREKDQHNIATKLASAVSMLDSPQYPKILSLSGPPQASIFSFLLLLRENNGTSLYPWTSKTAKGFLATCTGNPQRSPHQLKIETIKTQNRNTRNK